MNKDSIIKKIKSANKIAIFAHRDPDPDACGAMFGLREFCRNLGKEVVVFAKNTKPKYLHHIFPLDEAREDFVASDFDLVMLVDIHTINRTEKIFHNELKKANNIAIIDHHLINNLEGVVSKTYWIEDVASCSQMLLDLFKIEKMTPSQDCATYIYAGMMGDTDRFLHDNLTRQVFENAIFLQDCGARIQHVYNFLYRYITQEQIRVNKFFLNNLNFLEDGKVGYVIFTQKDIEKMEVDMDDIKTFSNKITTIKDVEVSFFCYEREKGIFKISMRSCGKDVSTFANSMGGGGHKCAAGFEVEEKPHEIKKLIQKWSKEIFNG